MFMFIVAYLDSVTLINVKHLHNFSFDDAGVIWTSVQYMVDALD